MEREMLIEEEFRRIWPSMGLEFVYRGKEMSLVDFKLKVKSTIKEILRRYAEINNNMRNLNENVEEAFKKLKFMEGKSKIIKGSLFVNKKYKKGKRALIVTI